METKYTRSTQSTPINIVLLLLILVLNLSNIGCQTDNTTIDNTPYLFPQILPQNIYYPTNPDGSTITQAQVALGKKLFFDPTLSADSTISCASCHHPNQSFSDTLSLSLGVQQQAGKRNAPSLLNIAYHPYFNRDGGSPTLTEQAIIPLTDHVEMGSELASIKNKIRNNETYILLAEKAYNKPLDIPLILQAIAAYQSTLISFASPYDYSEYGHLTPTEFYTEQTTLGYQIFTAHCSHCHTPPLFSNFTFKNNGLYQSYADSGRQRITSLPQDKALFKVPSLRNISQTAPYMHNGSMQSLQDVITHYNSGGKNHPNKHESIQELSLSTDEQQALLQFLETLTDNNYKIP